MSKEVRAQASNCRVAAIRRETKARRESEFVVSRGAGKLWKEEGKKSEARERERRQQN